MIDLSDTILAKSDQLNAVDLLGDGMVVKITNVTKNSNSKDQPVSIHFEGDEGRPFKPCKTMRRLLMVLWGKDGKQYIGRQLELYCDPDVLWGGKKKGGVRISGASHIDGVQKVTLPTSRNADTTYTIKKLNSAVAPDPKPKPEPAPKSTDFDFDGWDNIVGHALAQYTDHPDDLKDWWAGMIDTRKEARDADADRAGKIATKVNNALKGE